MGEHSPELVGRPEKASREDSGSYSMTEGLIIIGRHDATGGDRWEQERIPGREESR